MSASTTATDERVVKSEADLERLRAEARREGYDQLKDGGWFQRIVSKHIKKHATEINAAHWEQLYPHLDTEERAKRVIDRAIVKASAAGAFASVGASTGELLSLFTEGLAAPVGVPAAISSMVAEAAYTARLQIDLACDLASIYGVPFDPDDLGEVATLFGMALEVDIKKKKEAEESKEEKEAKSGVTASLMELEDGEFAKRIGRKLLEESVMRNIIPIVGIGISARWNWVATKKFAAAARKYARYRRALRKGCGALKLGTVDDPALLLEGAWLLATIDGDAGHEELLAMAIILDALPITAADLKLDGHWDDEEDWFERLKQAPPRMYEPLLDVLYMIAATDRELAAPEKRFLRRLGKAIGREIDWERVETITKHLAEGEDLPAGFLHGT